MKLPLFPLSSHILPEGRISLRIFEPRYIRMIKHACANSSGFVICMYNSEGSVTDNTHIFPIGTVCKVIDFNVLEGGLLGVTVEGSECVKLSQIEIEKDGLRIGVCKPIPKWNCGSDIDVMHPVDTRLQEVFERYPQISSLYQSTPFDDPIWVIYRWIELLPIGAQQKQHFLMQRDCKNVLDYLSQLIE